MSGGSVSAQIPDAIVRLLFHLSVLSPVEPSGGPSRSTGPFFDKLNLEIVFILVQSPSLNEASDLPEREESAVKRVLYSESGLGSKTPPQPPNPPLVKTMCFYNSSLRTEGLIQGSFERKPEAPVGSCFISR